MIDTKLLIQFFTGIGFILSMVFETVTFKWHGKDVKKWVFTGVALIVGGGLAVLNKEVALPNLNWETTPDILNSLASIMSYGAAVLAGSALWFKTNITKING